MYQNQRQTDGQTSEVVRGAIRLCRSTQYNKYEYTSEDNLSQQTAQHTYVSLQVVGTRTFQSWYVLCQHIQQQ